MPSGGGVFEVEADGELIHSKRDTGHFPEPSAVVDALRERSAGRG